ncbi:hypothetical protein Ark11_1356 [Candidatus Ichthyocystis hellenicum]|uniref:Uncharacterized protein n=2 Tax=Burkholderiales genera incertae sedis TaxID=224471 RepID=A0A0S4M4L2_9BURK|nr:hypothetical protein Ark11_1356 [Candidatus Ichthyocystis hellenicum]
MAFPYTLLEMSLMSVFGVSCKKSVECLSQISPKKAIEFAIIIKSKSIGCYRTKYESVFESNVDIQCHKNYDEFCFNNCDDLSNSEKVKAVISLKRSIDGIIVLTNDCFLKYFPLSEHNHFCSYFPIYQQIRSDNFMLRIMIFELSRLLLKLLDQIGLDLYSLINALLIQINYYNSLLNKLLVLRKNTMKGCSVRECLKNYMRCSLSLKEIVIPLIECCNFVFLEDLMKIFESKILDSRLERYRSTYELEIRNIYSFLKSKYSAIIINKRMRIKFLLKKIDLRDKDTLNKIYSFLKIQCHKKFSNRRVIIKRLLEKVNMGISDSLYKDDKTLIFVRSTIELVKKLDNEIFEMKLFLRKFMRRHNNCLVGSIIKK